MGVGQRIHSGYLGIGIAPVSRAVQCRILYDVFRMDQHTTDSPPPAAKPVPADWKQLHLWHIQPVRDLLVLGMLLGLIYLGYALRSVTVPMLLALLLAYLFEPLVQRLNRFQRVNRPMAVGGILAAFVLIVVLPTLLGAGFAVVQAVGLAGGVARNSGALIASVKSEDEVGRNQAYASLPRSWQYLSRRVSNLRQEVEQYRQHQAAKSLGPADNITPDAPAHGGDEHISEWKANVYDMVERGVVWVGSNAEGLAKTVGQQALSGGVEALRLGVVMVVSVAGLGFTVFLTGFFFFFFSTGWGKVRKITKEFIPKNKRYQTLDLLYQMDTVIAGFVRGRLTICAILGLVMMFQYWLIGVPMPLLLGAIVGALFIVPFIHVLGVPVAIVLLWLDPGTGPLAQLVGGIGNDGQATWWWILFAPLGAYLIAQFLDDWVLSVTISGKATNMDTPTILFASLAGGVLAGLYGVLLAIPVAACLKILVKEVMWPRFKQWAAGQAADFLPISTAPPQPAVVASTPVQTPPPQPAETTPKGSRWKRKT